jgi:hypothetical protein
VSAGAEIKQNGRPLEPDAGNADAGRPAVLFQHGFIFLTTDYTDIADNEKRSSRQTRESTRKSEGSNSEPEF